MGSKLLVAKDTKWDRSTYEGRWHNSSAADALCVPIITLWRGRSGRYENAESDPPTERCLVCKVWGLVQESISALPHGNHTEQICRNWFRIRSARSYPNVLHSRRTAL